MGCGIVGGMGVGGWGSGRSALNFHNRQKVETDGGRRARRQPCLKYKGSAERLGRQQRSHAVAMEPLAQRK